MRINLKSVKTNNTKEEQYLKVLEEQHEFLEAYIWFTKGKTEDEMLLLRATLAEEAFDYLQAYKTYSDICITANHFRFNNVAVYFDPTIKLKIFNCFAHNITGTDVGLFARYIFQFLKNQGIDVEKAWENHNKKMDERGWSDGRFE